MSKKKQRRPLFRKKHGDQPARRQNRRLLTESLEARQLLAADLPGDMFAEAQVVSLQAGTPHEIDATIGDGNFPASDVDLFQLDLVAGQTVNVDVDAYYFDDGTYNGYNLNTYLKVFDSSASELASNDSALSSNDYYAGWDPGYDSYLTFTAQTTGTYYVGVSDAGNTSYDPTSPGGGSNWGGGAYKLQLLAGSPPSPTISVGDVTVSEDGGTATFEITLSEAVANPVTLDFATTGGTAVEPSDYDATSGSLTFAAGETVKSVSVPIVDDTVHESDETFTLDITNVVGIDVGDASGLGTITNDDLPPGDPPGDPLVDALVVSLQAGVPVEIDATIGDGNFASSDVDLFKVDLVAGQTLSVDVDAYYFDDGYGNGYGLDTYLRIFDSSGTEHGNNSSAVSSNDYGSGWDPGYDSYLTFTASSTGTYYVGVSDEGNSNYDPDTAGSGGSNWGSGDYKLQLLAEGTPVPTISVGDVTASEDAGTIALEVTLSAAATETVTVDYATASGTATSDVDFGSATGTLTFLPGETTQNVPISVTDDAIDESDESFTLTLSNALGAPIAIATATATILDNDLPPGDLPGDVLTLANVVTLQPDVMAEFDEAIGNGNHGSLDVDLYRISLSSGQTLEVDVDAYYDDNWNQISSLDSYLRVFDSSGTQLASNDYAYASNDASNSYDAYLSFTAATDGDYYIGVSPTSNPSYDPNVAGSGSNSYNNTGDYRLQLLTDGPVTPPLPELSVANVSASEDAGTVTLSVTLSEAAADIATVDYATSTGTADSDIDFGSASGTLTFAAGETLQSVSITLTDDTIDENDEDFIFTLSNAVEATILTGTAIATIVDDELPAAAPRISISDLTLIEESGAAVLSVSLDVITTETVTVDFLTAGGTAIAGEDFLHQSGTITFSPGVSLQTISIPLVDDGLAESTETFSVGLSNPTNGILLDIEGEITVTDIDTMPNHAPVGIEDSFFVNESDTLSVYHPGVLVNDTDGDNDVLSAVLLSTPHHGTISDMGSDGSFVYVPNAGYSGTDSFEYAVTDGIDTSPATTVMITVVSQEIVNHPPQAVEDWFAVNVDTKRTVSGLGLLANDVDVDGDVLSAILVTATEYGEIQMFHADGTFEYTPDPGFVGEDHFTYRVDDGVNESDVVNVTLVVAEQLMVDSLVIEAPVAKNDVYLLHVDDALHVPLPGYLENDTDTSGDVTTHVLSRPRFGTLTLGESGAFDYHPFPGFVGTDSFRYQVTNEVGQSNPVTVELEVNAPPTVLDLETKPSIITVNTLIDVDALSDSWLVSLRRAIEIASANGPSLDIIEFAVPDASLKINESFGPIVVDSDLEIRGSAMGIVIEPQLDHTTSFFHVMPGTSVLMENIEMRGAIKDVGDGGTIWNAGDLTLDHVYITDSQSQSGRGGALFNAAGGSLTLANTTISSSTALSDGGGVFNAAGGNLHAFTSTISSNSAGLWGGGIYNAGELTAASTTIVLNEAATASNLAAVGSANIADSIIAMGIAGADADGVVTSGGGNLIGVSDGVFGWSSNDLTGTASSPLNPILGPLQDNGGASPTHMPLVGSPAIDAGFGIHGHKDQRGADRVVDGLDPNDSANDTERIDIGAVEFGTFFANVAGDGIDATPLGDGRVDIDLNTPGDQVSIRAAIQEFNAMAGHGNTAGLGSGEFEGAIAFNEVGVRSFSLELEGADEDLSAFGDLDVFGNLSIHAGTSEDGIPRVRIDGGWVTGQVDSYVVHGIHDRIFHLHPNSRFDVSDIIIQGGQADFDHGYGGAILNQQATALVANSLFQRNLAQHGGHIANLGGFTVLSSGSIVEDGYAALGAGAFVDSGSLTIDQGTFRGNVMNVGGAALYVKAGDVLVTNNSLIKDQLYYDQGFYEQGFSEYGFSDPQGAAIFIEGGTVKVDDNTQIQRNGWSLSENYESDNLADIYLLPKPAHVLADGQLYSAKSVVFVAEQAQFSMSNSSLTDQDSELANADIAIINLGNARIVDSLFESNPLTLANLNSGVAVIEGGIVRASAGRSVFSGLKPYLREMITYEYATTNLYDSSIQNQNGKLTLKGLEIEGLPKQQLRQEDVANFGEQSELSIIGSTFNGANLFNLDGNVHIADSLFHGGQYYWYDGEPDAVVQHSGHGRVLSALSSVPDLQLTTQLSEGDSLAHVSDASSLARFQLPYPVVVNEERMFVTSVDFDSNTLLLSRPHPRIHSPQSEIILRNEYTEQIAVEDVQEYAIYDLPFDIYAVNSLSSWTDQYSTTASDYRVPTQNSLTDAQVEVMTITGIDYEDGVLQVLRGRQGTAPARFNQDGASQHAWGVPGQMIISGTTFKDINVDIGSYWLESDSSVSVVRSVVSELAPPLASREQ